MRPRKLSKLGFQFRALAPDLSNEQICEALRAKGLIELIGTPPRYIESLAMRSIDSERFNEVIGAILSEFSKGRR